MKQEIHPEYHPKAKIACACGASYAVGSTLPEIGVELCAACHPFYTGKQKILDTARRVEKFTTRTSKKATVATGTKVKRAKRAAAKAVKTEEKAKKA
ncbi:50S ribosomal protein L31 [Patescibacteria group bacterium]|nr:MAG: 50S ribosomal protein L31 [Patescibacteria group bacterium]